MKKFLIKSSALSIIIIVVHFILAQFADGYTDAFYAKLSSPKQESLILGASRASEGIIPSVIDSVLETKAQKRGFFNYAFTDSDSPYGEVYFNAIKQKINKSGTNNTFILSVHPMSISNRLTKRKKLRESNLALAKISHFNNSPNYDYLLNSYGYGWGNILLKKMENSIYNYVAKKKIIKGGAWAYVHNDGWLEVHFINNDSAFFESKAKEKINQQYKYKLSQYRLDYLKKIIDELLNYGSVYLVRLPIDKRVLELENNMIPNFDSLMENLAKEKEIKYLNYSSKHNDYKYTDGNHFTNSSSKKFSIELANQILNP